MSIAATRGIGPGGHAAGVHAERPTLLVPVYNEAENFPRLLAEVDRHVPQPAAMLVVFDFDEDTTLPVAREAARTRPWLRLVRNEGRGVVSALRTGFNQAPDGPVIVVMADLSDDLSIVPAMLDLYRAGHQVVCPSRYARGGRQVGGHWLKRRLSRLAGWSLWWAGFPTHDATNNFRLYDAALVRELGIDSSGGFEVALELTAKAFRNGTHIAEIPTTWRDRTAGSSRFKLWTWLPRYLRWYVHALGGIRRPGRTWPGRTPYPSGAPHV
jgi:glycosyltransferase involved in cell wall biosynthesis